MSVALCGTQRGAPTRAAAFGASRGVPAACGPTSCHSHLSGLTPLLPRAPPPAPAVLAYFIAALSPNMDVANAALPTYVVVSSKRALLGGDRVGEGR